LANDFVDAEYGVEVPELNEDDMPCWNKKPQTHYFQMPVKILLLE